MPGSNDPGIRGRGNDYTSPEFGTEFTPDTLSAPKITPIGPGRGNKAWYPVAVDNLLGLSVPPQAPSLVQYYSGGASPPGSTSYVISLAAGTTANNIVVVAIYWNNSSYTITPPSGWNLIDADLRSSDARAWFYWHLASANETSWTFTLGIAAYAIQHYVLEFTNVSTTSPINGYAQNSQAGGTNPTSSTGIVPTVYGCLPLVFSSPIAAGAQCTNVTNGGTYLHYIAGGGGDALGLGAFLFSVATDLVTSVGAASYTFNASGSGGMATETILLAPIIAVDAPTKLQTTMQAITDTISSTFSDATTKLQTLARALTDTFSSTVSDSATRSLQSFARSLSDTFSGTFSDAVARITQLHFSASDNFSGTVSDSVARLTGLHFVASDTLAAISESASAMKVILRTAADTLSAMSDSAARSLQNFVRSLSDTLAAMSDTATRLSALHPTVSDSFGGSFSDATQSALLQTASDTLVALTDTATRVLVLLRTATDSTAAPSDSVARISHLHFLATDTLAILVDLARAPYHAHATAVDTLSATFSEFAWKGKYIIVFANDTLGAITEGLLTAFQRSPLIFLYPMLAQGWWNLWYATFPPDTTNLPRPR